MKTPHEKREIRAEAKPARGGWSGGPVRDNPRERFWCLVVAAVALLATVGVIAWALWGATP